MDLLAGMYRARAGCAGLDGEAIRFVRLFLDKLESRGRDHLGARLIQEAHAFVLMDRQGSASESCLTAAMAARERALRHLATTSAVASDADAVPGSDVPVSIREKYGQKLVMYGSTQTHSLGAKVCSLRLRKASSAGLADLFSRRRPLCC